MYHLTVPTAPLYTTQVNGRDVEVLILHLMKYPETIQGGQPELYEVIFDEVAKLDEEEGCPIGK